jgi:hypothetical protein
MRVTGQGSKVGQEARSLSPLVQKKAFLKAYSLGWISPIFWCCSSDYGETFLLGRERKNILKLSLPHWWANSRLTNSANWSHFVVSCIVKSHRDGTCIFCVTSYHEIWVAFLNEPWQFVYLHPQHLLTSCWGSDTTGVCVYVCVFTLLKGWTGIHDHIVSSLIHCSVLRETCINI